MRFEAVLMRTEWTDPWPQRHWGPPPQIHRRYQFRGVLFKRPQCGIPYYTIANSPKAPIIPFLPLHCSNSRNCSSLFFLFKSTLEILQMPLVKNLLWNCWQSSTLFSDCVMDRNTDIPIDVPSLLDVWDPSLYILWLYAHFPSADPIIKSQLENNSTGNIKKVSHFQQIVIGDNVTLISQLGTADKIGLVISADKSRATCFCRKSSNHFFQNKLPIILCVKSQTVIMCHVQWLMATQ